MRKIKQTRHGYHGTKIYKLWASIVHRCETKTCAGYKYYGGRGITVCKSWRDSPKTFIEWAVENGYSEGLEIDRIDGDGNYAPNNCRFVTKKENSAPMRRKFKNKSGHRNIIKTKAGTFEAYYQSNGKQHFIKTFKTLDEAIKARDSKEFTVIGTIHDEVT
jgi:hypothetical protein